MYVTVPLAFTTTLPLLGPDVIVTVPATNASLSGDASASFVNTAIVTAVSSSVVAESSDATGAGFVTVQVNVSLTDAPSSSVAVTVTV